MNSMLFKRQSDGEPLLLDPETVLGAGGQARVFAVQADDALAAKIYHKPKDETAHKLAVMLANPPDDPMAAQGHVSIAWPLDLLLTPDSHADVVGFLMPRVQETRPLIAYYNPMTRRRDCPLFNYLYLHRTARNLAAAVNALHSRGYVIGDVNESNILVTDTALVTMVDTDSFQVRDPVSRVVYRCPVGKPEYTPPEAQGQSFRQVERLPHHDRFGLAALIFQLLMEGTHPFAGVFSGEGDPPPYEIRIRNGHFPYGDTLTPYRPLPIAPRFEIVAPVLARLFLRCFEKGHTDPKARPDAQTWVAALQEAENSLVVCERNDQHYFGSHLRVCPWCERTLRLGGRDPFPSRESVQTGQHLQAPTAQTPLPSAATPTSVNPPPGWTEPQTTPASPVAVLTPPPTPSPLPMQEGATHPAPPANPPPPLAPRITVTTGARSSDAVLYRRSNMVALIGVITLAVIGIAAYAVLHLHSAPSTPTPPSKHSAPPNPQLASEADAKAMRKAAEKGDEKTVKEFLNRYPQIVSQTNPDKWTPLHFAAFFNHPAIVQLLLDNNADVNAQEKDGFTPLHLAAQNGRVEVTRILLDHGADVNAKEHKGWTPLHFAAMQGHADVAKLLLDHGADPNAVENTGLTPLAVAKREGKTAVENLLRQHGGQ